MDRAIMLVDADHRLVFENRPCTRLDPMYRTVLCDRDGPAAPLVEKCLGSTAPLPCRIRLPKGGNLRFKGQRLKLEEWPEPLALLRLDPKDQKLMRFQVVSDQLQHVTATLRKERRRARILAERARDLHRKVETDQLTYLLSRSAFEERVTRRLLRGLAGRSVLIVLDLNDFKRVNDTYGHLAGDMVLMTTGQRICGLIRETDIASRFGGDEFCLFLDGPISRPDAEAAVNRLQDGLAQPIVHRATDRRRVDLRVSASIGAVRIDPGDRNLPQLIQAADAAMYAAKRSADRAPVFAWDTGAAGECTIRRAG